MALDFNWGCTFLLSFRQSCILGLVGSTKRVRRPFIVIRRADESALARTFPGSTNRGDT